jgi:hypothetical protein
MKVPAPPEVKSVAPSRIPQVAAVTKAIAAYKAWQKKHPDAAAELLELADEYNAKLKAADAVVRELRVTSGPFELFQFARKDNAQALYDAVGRQKFTALGGVLKTVDELSIDRARFDGLVAEGKVDEDVVAAVVSFGPKFHTPDPITLP